MERHLLLAYDDLYSIELLHRRLCPYWRRNGADANDLLRDAAKDYLRITSGVQSLRPGLHGRYGADWRKQYADLAALAYRQALAANKLTAGANGEPLYFGKENFSDGSISTPDVIHPECPILLLFNPELLRASLVPVLEYVSSEQWKFPFAPAQLGTYPLANGQTYDGGEKSEEGQQPVEESGNMLIMTAALAKSEQSPELAVKYWPVLPGGRNTSKRKGLIPRNNSALTTLRAPRPTMLISL